MLIQSRATRAPSPYPLPIGEREQSEKNRPSCNKCSYVCISRGRSEYRSFMNAVNVSGPSLSRQCYVRAGRVENSWPALYQSNLSYMVPPALPYANTCMEWTILS
jgi:hypothetical protein